MAMAMAMAMATMACCRSSSSLLRSLLCIRVPPRSSPTFFTFSSSHATRLLTSTPGLASGSCNPASVHKNFCELRGRVRDLSLGFTSRAGSGSSPGAIDSPLISSMQAKIKEQLNAEVVLVIDTSGDGRHVSIDVVATAFEGKSAVNRQRMVYKAIWEELKEVVHAVDQLRTRTPQEVADAKSQL